LAEEKHDDKNEEHDEELEDVLDRFSFDEERLGCNSSDDDNDTEEGNGKMKTPKCETCEKKEDCVIRDLLTRGVKDLSDRHQTLPLRLIASKSYATEAVMNLLLDEAPTKTKAAMLTLCAMLFKNVSVIDGFNMKQKALEYIKQLEDAEENSPYGFCHSAENVTDALGIDKASMKLASSITDDMIKKLSEGGKDHRTHGHAILMIKATTAQMNVLLEDVLNREDELVVKSLSIANFLRKLYMGTITFKLTV